jgi:HEAT repeat protein
MTCLEKLLDEAEEDLVCRIARLLGQMQDDRSAQVLLNITHTPSERVRKEALKAVIVRDLRIHEKLIWLMDDENKLIRELFIRYLGSRRNEAAEKLLLNYLQKRPLGRKYRENLSFCLKALGRCGTSCSLPFLRDTLLGGGWISKCRSSARQKGAAVALAELDTEQARKVLLEASRSRFPGIRRAAQAVISEKRGSGRNR